MTKPKFSETLHQGFSVSYQSEEILFEDRTEHQDLVLFQNRVFGQMLMLDGVTQVTSADEFIYHEMLAHVPILGHGNVSSVLIIGGGDCGLAEEVLKHKSVQKLTQVEIDPSVVEFSKKHFSAFNAPVFEDDRFELVIADGAEFMAESPRQFDIILVDSTDPIGPGKVLFEEAFYRAAHARLTPGGVLVTQNGVPFLQADELEQSITSFNRIFADAWCYIAAIPTYVGGHMALGWTTDNKNLRHTPVAQIKERFDDAGIETRYYTPEVHAAAFALPRFILDTVEKGKSKS